MGIFNDLFGFNRFFQEPESIKRRQSLRNRICRIEEVESREMLSASPYVAPDPINVGVVYHENYYDKGHVGQEDRGGDTFTVSWNGGVEGTTLQKIVIDLRTADGEELMYFNVDPDSPQDPNGEAFPFKIVSQSPGIGITYQLSENNQVLEIFFENFTADGRVVFNIDVNLVTEKGIMPIVNGAHVAGSKLSAVFSAQNYETLIYETGFVDYFKDPGDFDLSVPADDYGSSRAAQTAGVVDRVAEIQTPLSGSISGYVYEDSNNNGIREDHLGEQGIEGVTLGLYVWNGEEYVPYIRDNEHLTATSGANGFYKFDNIDGGRTYTVVEIQPEGWIDGLDSVGTIDGVTVGETIQSDRIGEIHLGANEHGVEYNFGEYRYGSISGHVYEDDNDNGRRDEDEKGVPGVTVRLCEIDEDGQKHFIRETTTDENGEYYFGELEPGKKYCVTEVDPAGYCDGETNVGTVDGKEVGSVWVDVPEGYDQIHDIYIGSGDRGIEYNFGENLRGSLSGYVYEDVDQNGRKDDDERGIVGVVVTLWVWNGERYVETGKTATTNKDGRYEFTGLCPHRRYMVAEQQPQDYDDGGESVGWIGDEQVGRLPDSDDDTITDILLPPGGVGTDYNFGEYIPPVVQPEKGKLSGFVYVDENDNGNKDADEPGIAGVTVTLWKKTGETYQEIATATTDAKGAYSFDDLDPDETYMIVETQPDAYLDGRDSVGTLGGVIQANDEIREIVLGEGQHGRNYNFGEQLRPEIPPPDPDKGSLSGYVYVDRNDNGTKDAGEKGIAGVTVSLWKLVDGRYTPIKTTSTDSKGFYIFADLDPNERYMITETQPKNYKDGRDSVGTLGGTIRQSDEIRNIFVGENRHGENYNFGEGKTTTEEPIDPPVEPIDPPVRPIDPPPFYIPPPSAAVGGGPAGRAGLPFWQFPTLNASLQSGYGGGGLPSGFSWHLSVINGGYPRGTVYNDGVYTATTASQSTLILNEDSSEGDPDAKTRYVSVAWTPTPMNQSVWYVRDKDGKITKRFQFGPDGGRPIVGDFNGDGIGQVAVFHEGNWYIDLNGNGVWDEEDLWCELGAASDQPIVGDWDGDGKADIGIFGPQWAGDAAIVANEPGLPSDLNETYTARPKNMPPTVAIDSTAGNIRAMKHSQSGSVRLDVIDHVFQYGGEGDQAFTGDFTGDGVKKVGVYRNGAWYIDYNGNGRWDSEDLYVENADQGLGKDGIVVVGDFNGDGIDNIGLYVNGVWHLDTTGDFRFDTKIEFGEPGDYPVVGDFDGDGIAQLALYRSSGLDSLQTLRMPQNAPAVSVSPQYAANVERAAAPGASQAEAAEKVADQFAEETTDQGTLPEKLQRHGRTMRTPHTNVPLHRPGR